MKNVWSIAKKELQAYFSSPIAYVVIAVFLLLVGFFFYSLVLWFKWSSPPSSTTCPSSCF
jgi:ABC-2 type transport system permease protein